MLMTAWRREEPAPPLTFASTGPCHGEAAVIAVPSTGLLMVLVCENVHFKPFLPLVFPLSRIFWIFAVLSALFVPARLAARLGAPLFYDRASPCESNPVLPIMLLCFV